MNKNELVCVVSDKLNINRVQTEDILNCFLDTICEYLSNGEKVVISGFGTFEIRYRIQRTGKNPRTGEEMIIPGQKTPAFRAGRGLKQIAMNSKNIE